MKEIFHSIPYLRWPRGVIVLFYLDSSQFYSDSSRLYSGQFSAFLDSSQVFLDSSRFNYAIVLPGDPDLTHTIGDLLLTLIDHTYSC